MVPSGYVNDAPDYDRLGLLAAQTPCVLPHALDCPSPSTQCQLPCCINKICYLPRMLNSNAFGHVRQSVCPVWPLTLKALTYKLLF